MMSLLKTLSSGISMIPSSRPFLRTTPRLDSINSSRWTFSVLSFLEKTTALKLGIDWPGIHNKLSGSRSYLTGGSSKVRSISTGLKWSLDSLLTITRLRLPLLLEKKDVSMKKLPLERFSAFKSNSSSETWVNSWFKARNKQRGRPDYYSLEIKSFGFSS